MAELEHSTIIVKMQTDMNDTDGPMQVRAKTVRGFGTQVGGKLTNQALGQFPLKKKTPTVTRTSAPPWDRREVRGAPENTLRLVRHR